MRTIELSENEAALLRRLLETRLRDVALELAHTDHAAYRIELRARETLLQSILDRIDATSASRVERVARLAGVRGGPV